MIVKNENNQKLELPFDPIRLVGRNRFDGGNSVRCASPRNGLLDTSRPQPVDGRSVDIYTSPDPIRVTRALDEQATGSLMQGDMSSSYPTFPHHTHVHSETAHLDRPYSITTHPLPRPTTGQAVLRSPVGARGIIDCLII
jgi:hypothetical protein